MTLHRALVLTLVLALAATASAGRSVRSIPPSSRGTLPTTDGTIIHRELYLLSLVNHSPTSPLHPYPRHPWRRWTRPISGGYHPAPVPRGGRGCPRPNVLGRPRPQPRADRGRVVRVTRVSHPHRRRQVHEGVLGRDQGGGGPAAGRLVLRRHRRPVPGGRLRLCQLAPGAQPHGRHRVRLPGCQVHPVRVRFSAMAGQRVHQSSGGGAQRTQVRLRRGRGGPSSVRQVRAGRRTPLLRFVPVRVRENVRYHRGGPGHVGRPTSTTSSRSSPASGPGCWWWT
jgi:hypothetical protein